MLKVSDNYRQTYADLNCPLCSQGNGEEASVVDTQKFIDEQHHLLHCIKLVGSPPANIGERCCEYKDLFSNDVNKMLLVANRLEASLNKREEILDKQ